jgi:hypothetical protein
MRIITYNDINSEIVYPNKRFKLTRGAYAPLAA